MGMADRIETKPSWKYKFAQVVLLLLAVVTFPLGCCGCTLALTNLPGVSVGLFQTDVQLENRTGETLRITPISTTQAGPPQIIWQPAYLRQIDIPIEPNQSISLRYNSADQVLDGIAVCRENGDCRLLVYDRGDLISLESFEDLPLLDPSWLQVIQTANTYRFDLVVFSFFGLVPVVLFLSALYLSRLEKKPAGANGFWTRN